MANYKAMKEMVNSTSSGKYFKPADGENHIRVVTEPFPTWKAFDQATKHAQVYLTESEAKKNDKARPRFQMYILNRDMGNKLQIAEFGPQVMDQFCDLAIMSETAFESLPPYDMVLVKTGAGMDTEYKLHASRKNTDLLPEEKAAIAAAKPLIEDLLEDDQVVDKDAYRGIKPLTESAMVPPAAPNKEIDVRDIPFG